jgi:hypothetical protein
MRDTVIMIFATSSALSLVAIVALMMLADRQFNRE